MATTRFSERNFARPGIRRNPVECNKAMKPLKETALQPSTRPLSSNVLGTGRVYETRLKKASLLAQPVKKTTALEKPKPVKQTVRTFQ